MGSSLCLREKEGQGGVGKKRRGVLQSLVLKVSLEFEEVYL